MSAVPQIYLDHLTAVTGPDPASLRDSWEPDGVLEFPYAVSLAPTTRFEGADAIADFFAGGAERFGPFEFSDMHAWQVADSDDYVLEMHGSSTVTATGAPYEQDYVVRFGLSERGKLAWMREFWDPTRM